MNKIADVAASTFKEKELTENGFSIPKFIECNK